MKLIKLFYKKKYREKLYDNVSKDINAYFMKTKFNIESFRD